MGWKTPEQRRAYMREYRKRITPEQRAKYNALWRKWYAKDPARHVKRVIEWVKDNADKKSANDKRYKTAHREIVNERMREW